MPYVVCEPCIHCKYTDGTKVCPLDAFYERPIFQAIHPDECIDRNACVPICPTEAIYSDGKVPETWLHSIEWNRYLAVQWQVQGFNITQKKAPLPETDAWRNRSRSEKDILTWDVSEAS